jgi:diguanylate cyclase (GGDEF)-like protein
MTEQGPQKRILIADDDAVSRRMLNALLVMWGYQVEVSTDGEESLRILSGDNSPRLAVLDWMMPGLEGPEICQRVRARSSQPYTYILLLTGRSQKEDLLRGLESGADDYLTKPFDAHELNARLRVGQRILDLQGNLVAAREELRFRATHNALTGIANHATVLEAMQREHARQERSGISFAICLLDLDHFKRVNDTYGHLCGDAVLKETARRIADCVRPYDIVGRYGGEEFLVVAPSTDAAGAYALAERVRRRIEAEPIHADAEWLRITASCGVAVNSPAVDRKTLLNSADRALYRAKEQGKNRSELATASLESVRVKENSH